MPVGPTGQNSSARHTWAPPLDGPPSMGSRFTRWVSKPSLPVGVQSFARWVSKSSCSRASVNSLSVGERDQWVSTKPASVGVHQPRGAARCPRTSSAMSAVPSGFSRQDRGCPQTKRASATRPAVGVLEPRISGCPRLAPVGVQDWTQGPRFPSGCRTGGVRSTTVHFRRPSSRGGERRWCEGWPVADAGGRWPQRSRMRHVGGSRFSEAHPALLVAAAPKGLRQVGG